MKKIPVDKNYFAALTGVRAIAAFMVFFHHENQTNRLFLPEFFYRLMMEFHTGVTLFFVLSGFLITYRYYDGFSISRNWFLKYFINRAARIYPMFLLLTILTFVVGHYSGTGEENVTVILANIFLVKGFFNELKFTGIAQGWSLTVEECFYFLAPIFFLVCTRKIKIFFIPILLFLIGLISVQVFKSATFYGLMINNQFMVFYTFFGRSFEFFTGMYLAFYIRKMNVSASKTFIKYKTFTGIAFICTCLLIMMYTASFLNIKFSINSYTGLFINNIILPLCIALFFAGLITEQTFIKNFLKTGLMQVLGKSSYIFYLIHLGFISKWLSLQLVTGNSYLDLILLFIVLNIISITLFRLVEEPLNKYIRRIYVPVKLKAIF